MKIVFCTPGNLEFADYRNGNLLGTEFQIFGLSAELLRRGHEVYIIRKWFKGCSKYENIKGIHIINIFIFNSKKQKNMQKILFSWYVKKEINKIRPDILILSEILSSYFICTLPTPKIYVTHNNPGRLYSSNNSFKQYIRMFTERRIFRNCNLMIALNNEIGEYLSKNGYNSLVIPNALEIDEYGLETFDFNSIMYGGRFDKIKGLEILIEAYSMLSEDIQKNYQLLLVGDGPNKTSIKNSIYNLGISDRVDFVPWLPSKDFIKQISGCSIFVLPSLSECMPVSLIEAMALGKPVIASDIPGPKDIVISGYNGLLFEKKNADELKNCIELLITNKDFMLKIGRNAKKTIEERYSFSIIADKYESIFKMLVE